MKKALLLSLCILALGIDSVACTLGAIPSTFCQAVKFNHYLIASGKILQKIDRGYLIEIEEVFRGEENRCQVKVFEQADWNCTGTLFDYEIVLAN